MRRGSLTVKSGERVRTGQIIGAVGNSGNSLVPHLHVEMLDGPDPVAAGATPFRVRTHDRWTGRSWERVHDSVLRRGERVRAGLKEQL
ncbi:MAG: M23 family metallopeptidase [candidate division NC10 bacterium]|nr:M23 family metallopeptidase [Candidatus Rokubacteria bacterium]MBI2561417.1 M23 family metallopeptidase [candidate division NC10 bacterium]